MPTATNKIKKAQSDLITKSDIDQLRKNLEKTIALLSAFITLNKKRLK